MTPSILSLKHSEVEQMLQALHSPESQLSSYFRIALEDWSSDLSAMGMANLGAAKGDDAAVWLLVSAIVSLQQELDVNLSAKQCWSLSRTSEADGRRKLKLAVELGLIKYSNPVINGVRKKRIKICIATALGCELYQMQVKRFASGFTATLKSVSQNSQRPGGLSMSIKRGVADLDQIFLR